MLCNYQTLIKTTNLINKLCSTGLKKESAYIRINANLAILKNSEIQNQKPKIQMSTLNLQKLRIKRKSVFSGDSYWIFMDLTILNRDLGL